MQRYCPCANFLLARIAQYSTQFRRNSLYALIGAVSSIPHLTVPITHSAAAQSAGRTEGCVMIRLGSMVVWFSVS